MRWMTWRAVSGRPYSGVTGDMLYGAKKRAITMMAAVAVNPPVGSNASCSPRHPPRYKSLCLE